MSNIRIHSLEGQMIFSEEGSQKLIKLLSSEKMILVFSSDKEKLLDTEVLIKNAKEHNEKLWIDLEKKEELFNSLINRMLEGEKRNTLLELIRKGFTNLEDILKAVWLVGDISYGTIGFLDYIVGTWVVKFAQYIIEDAGFQAKTKDYIQAIGMKKKNLPDVLLVNAPLHKNKESFDSEVAASNLAVHFKLKDLTYWNSISLLRTADVNEVPSAFVISKLCYSEATELSFFGSHFIKPQALTIAIEENCEICIRCWNDFDDPGTKIISDNLDDNENTVKGFSVIHNISLINIEGAGLSGRIGFSSSLFKTMKLSGISVILYSQASSEYSICLAIPSNQGEKAVNAIKTRFANEIKSGIVHSIECTDNLAIIAAVGNNMAGRTGVSGQFFRSLGKAGVNVKAIAQGSSERNISAVIEGESSRRALRALHAAFFLSRQALSIGLIGPGNIGATLIDQISNQQDMLKDKFGLDIRIRAIASSKKMLLSQEGLDLENWKEEFDNNSVPCDLDVFANHVSADYFPHRAIIDCTSSSFIADKYIDWMKQGMHIVTPNKKAGTADYNRYLELFNTCLNTGRRFFYETTVGAGLPIIGTLKDLVQTGDNVRKIEGIVSGTLAWLFNNYDGTVPFSQLVKKAKEMGYTEPDPRDDLSGMDVGRKTVILARELGYKVEVADMEIESLVPNELSDLPINEFMDKLDQLDEPLLQKFNEAKKENKRLCYVGLVDENGICSVTLKGYPVDHPFSQASGTDNVICFTTDRYLTQPLVVKGPGAGREVTAGGVFSDILRLSAYLGARI